MLEFEVKMSIHLNTKEFFPSDLLRQFGTITIYVNWRSNAPMLSMICFTCLPIELKAAPFRHCVLLKVRMKSKSLPWYGLQALRKDLYSH